MTTGTAPYRSRAQALAGLLRASHPGPVLAVSAAATIYAVAVGRGPYGSAAVASAVLAGQLGIGWHNDALDAPLDRAAGRVEKPVATGELSANLVRTAAVAALFAAAGLSFLSGWKAAIFHLGALASALSYNAWLKRTAASVLCYLVAFGLLPMFVSEGLSPQRLPPAYLPCATAMLGAAAHFLNVLPDRAADSATGVRGLPHHFGELTSVGIAVMLFNAAGWLLAAASGADRAVVVLALVSASSLMSVAMVASYRLGHTRVPFQLALFVALIDVGLVYASLHP